MRKQLSIISAFFITSNFCAFAEDASALTAPVIEVTWVGTSTIDTLTDYVPPISEVLVSVRVNGGTDNGDGTIEPGGVVLNWQENSQTANVFMRSMPVLYNLLYQDYRYMKRIDPYGNGTKIYWWVTAQNVDGETSSTEIDSFVVGTLALEHEPLPSVFKILGNYPNPFNPKTNFELSVPLDGYVSVNVYNVMGQLVEVLMDDLTKSGVYSLEWNADNVPSGVYMIKAFNGNKISTQKVMLLK